MRFLSMIRLDEKRGQMPSEQLMNDMGKLLKEMNPRRRVDQHCRPTPDGGRVRLRGGKLSTTDGPFMETKEVIGATPSSRRSP